MSWFSSKFSGDREGNSQKGQIWFMFPPMYNSEILAPLNSHHKMRAPDLNKDRPKL